MSSEVDTTTTQDPAAAPAPAEPAPSPSPEGPAAPVEAPQTTTETPPETVDWKARHDTLERERIPSLMSERDRASNEAKGYRERAQAIAGEFEGWIEFGAQRGMTAAELLERIRGSKAQAENRQRDTQATQAETVTVLNGLYRAGESEFARFLEGLREAEPTLRITSASIPAFRKTFDAIAPKSTTAAVAAAVASGTKTPPKVPAPAGAPSSPEPAWKKGVKPKDLLARAFNR